MGVKPTVFSHRLEKDYYSRKWPIAAVPYLHLEGYVRGWMDPIVFKDKTILEIGAGEGGYSRLIAGLFDPKRVIACELFEERLLPGARENCDSRVSFVAGDCFRLPVRNESCDVVWGSGVLSQLPNLADAVAEIHRVLTPQGLYLGFEPNFFNIGIVYRFFVRAHSRNQYLLTLKDLDVFRTMGFDFQTTFFYAKIPWLRNRFFTTCVGIRARKIGA